MQVLQLYFIVAYQIVSLLLLFSVFFMETHNIAGFFVFMAVVFDMMMPIVLMAILPLFYFMTKY